MRHERGGAPVDPSIAPRGGCRMRPDSGGIGREGMISWWRDRETEDAPAGPWGRQLRLQLGRISRLDGRCWGAVAGGFGWEHMRRKGVFEAGYDGSIFESGVAVIMVTSRSACSWWEHQANDFISLH